MKLMRTPTITCFSEGEVMLFFPPLSLKAEAIKATSGKSLCLQNREYMKSKSLSSTPLALFIFPSSLCLSKKQRREEIKKKRGKERKNNTDLDSLAKKKKNPKKRKGTTRCLHPDSAFMPMTRVLLAFVLLRRVCLCSWLFTAQENQV